MIKVIRFLRSAFLAAALIGSSAATAAAYDIGPNSKLNFSYDVNYYQNSIGGPNGRASFLTPGRFATHNLGLLHNYTSTTTGKFWETSLNAREADDVRIEASRYSLKQFYTKFGDKKNDAIIGDYQASLSPYSLGTSLKGARYTRKLLKDDSLEWTGLFGTSASSWENLYTNNRTETVDRKFYGTRVSKKFEGDARVAANAVVSDDSRARYNTSAVLSNQKIFSSDWALPTFHNLALYGESAFSKTDNDNPTTSDTSQRGWAHLVKGDFSYKRFRTENEFERVSPDYATTGGSASPDLLRLRTGNKYRLTDDWQLTANYTWFHNNLNHAAGAFRTTTFLPEAGIRYDGPDWRPSFSAESMFRARDAVSTDRGLRSRTRSISNNVADRFGKLDVGVDYEHQYEDKSDRTIRASHHIVAVNLGYSYVSKSSYSVTPKLAWTVQRDRDELLGLTDQTTVLTGNLAARSPWGGTASASYGRSLVRNAANPSTDRRSVTAMIGYDIRNNSDRHVEARYKHNSNNSTRSGQDFTETTVQMLLSLKL